MSRSAPTTTTTTRGSVALLTATVCCLASLALSPPASAGWLDWIREYDLNDYALGAAVTTTQSPYTNAKNSVFVYPYLTSFRNSAFTNDWLLLRDGGIGARKVTAGDWEFGALVRVNTGGLGNGDPPELRGLREREWSIDAGPLVGWRGWPVHINLDTYGEITGRHNGYSAKLRFSFPLEMSRGFFIPAVEARWASGDYNDYYYGIAGVESRPGRPEYTAGADTNWRIQFDYGYRLTPRWLLRGYVAGEWLGDEVRNSPIVDRDHILSVNVGLAYNADLFNARAGPYPGFDEPRIEIRLGAFNDRVSSDASRTDANGIPGDLVKFEDAFDDDNVWTLDAEILFRFRDYHRIELGYFGFGRDGILVATDSIDFGDIEIPADTAVAVDSRFSSLVTAYSYSLMKDLQKELGVTAGLHFTRLRWNIDTESGASDSVDDHIILPVIGAYGSLALGQKMRLAAKLQLFGSDIDRYEGLLYSGALELSRSISPRARLGLGVKVYTLRLSSSRDSIRGTVRSRHVGPTLSLHMAF